jgi:nitrite reductase (NADH) small subunit
MKGWIDIGRLDDILPLGARVVRARLGDIAIFRTADNKVFALADRCPHKGGPLSQGIVHGERVTCPLHNWVVGLGDGQAIAPDRGCVARYPVKVEDGIIRLFLGTADPSGGVSA